MILNGTVINIIDNSGAKTARCLKILNSKKSIGNVGDIILVSIQTTFSKQKKKVKKGEMHRALITETKRKLRRADGNNIQSFSNNAVLVSNKNLPIGTRVHGTVPYELRNENFIKILSLASYVI